MGRSTAPRIQYHDADTLREHAERYGRPLPREDGSASPRIRYRDADYARVRERSDRPDDEREEWSSADQETDQHFNDMRGWLPEPKRLPLNRAPRFRQIVDGCYRHDPFAAFLRQQWHWIDKACRQYDSDSWSGVRFDEDEFSQELAVRLWKLYAKVEADPECDVDDAGRQAGKTVFNHARNLYHEARAEKRGGGMISAFSDVGLTWNAERRVSEYAATDRSRMRKPIDLLNDDWGDVVPADPMYAADNPFPYGPDAQDLLAVDRLRCDMWAHLLADVDAHKVDAFRRYYGIVAEPYAVDAEWNPYTLTYRTQPLREACGLPGPIEDQKAIAADMYVSARAVRGWLRDVEAYLDVEWPRLVRELSSRLPEVEDVPGLAEYLASAARDGWQADSLRLQEKERKKLFVRFRRLASERISAVDEFDAYVPPAGGYRVEGYDYHVWPFEVLLSAGNGGRLRRHVVNLRGPGWRWCSMDDYEAMIRWAEDVARARFLGDLVEAVSPDLPETVLHARTMRPDEYDSDRRPTTGTKPPRRRATFTKPHEWKPIKRPALKVRPERRPLPKPSNPARTQWLVWGPVNPPSDTERTEQEKAMRALLVEYEAAITARRSTLAAACEHAMTLARNADRYGRTDGELLVRMLLTGQPVEWTSRWKPSAEEQALGAQLDEALASKSQ